MKTSWSEWAPLPLRVILGIAFLYHGAPKLFSAAQHQGFVTSLNGIGVPLPGLMAWVVGLVEFLGGLALIAGAFIIPAAILLMTDMLVAMFAVHLRNGFNFIHIIGMTPSGPKFGMPGYEVNLLYIAGLLALILGGPGAWSVDRARRLRTAPA